MSHQPAISEEEKNRLLRNADLPAPYKRIVDMNFEIRAITSEQGFQNKAMYMRGTEQYKWAHETPTGIVWLWSKQEDADTRKQWLDHKIAHWHNFNYSPTRDSQSRGRSMSRNPSPRRNGASAADSTPNERSISPTKRGIGSGKRGGGSRKRRTAHKKRKAHRKSKRVHRTRRKHTRRHHHRHRHRR